MKYIKKFESKLYHDFSIDKFIKDANDFISDEEIKKEMKIINFPTTFKDEYKILYYLYKPLTSSFYILWKKDNKKENDYIRRQVKKYVRKILYNYYVELYDYLNSWNWHSIRTSLERNILFNFYTAIKKLPLNKKINNYNF